MGCHPASHESLEALGNLKRLAEERGERCLSVLLAGVDLYVRLGREMELLELMRAHAEEARESVEGTPTAEDLRKLFEATESE